MSRPWDVSKQHILLSEINAVTASMRRNSRWASRSNRKFPRDDAVSDSIGLRRPGHSASSSFTNVERQEYDLLAGFENLRQIVRETPDITTLPIPILLDPFLALIKSQLSTGPITSVVLNSLSVFIHSGIIFIDGVDVVDALSTLSHAVAHCKFEASDVSGDEVVTLRILTVIHDCILSEAGQLLGDFEICEMLETVLTTACQIRLSELLRRSAATTMHAAIRHVFSRLKDTDLTLPAVSPTSPPVDEQPSEEPRSDSPETLVQGQNDEKASPPPSPRKTPYGLPAALELLRVLINLIDPNDKQHTDSTRLTALSVVSTAFEVAGHVIRQVDDLRSMVVDRGCKFLLLLARSEHPALLYLSLRVLSTMFETMRPYLKLQQELFLAFTLDRLAPPPPVAAKVAPGRPVPTTPNGGSQAASPSIAQLPDDGTSDASSIPAPRPTALPARGETRELLLGTLTHMCRSPSFLVDLFVNYDCDLNCENLVERLIAFCTKGVYPTLYMGGLESSQHSSQAACLELLLTFMQHMARRSEGICDPWPENSIPSEELIASKSQKQLVLAGAAKFNTKPKLGIEFLEENKLIYADGLPRPLSLAKFLRSCSRLDKKLLGDFVSRPDNLAVLEEFMGLLDFKGAPPAEAMRELLEAFRLPGEAQQIARITETFASKYFATEPDVVQNEDAVYVLAYSIIMLNTDLHNPQVRKRMTLDDYCRNLRGVNNGKDFPPEYLQAIYESIRKKEIVMPEEHLGQIGFEYAWKELLLRSQKSGSLIVCNSDLFDRHLFKLIWKPIITSLAFAFTHFDDDHTVQHAITGFQQCATLAAKFQMPEVFDHIVLSVSPSTNLLGMPTPTTYNYPVTEVEGQTVTVSPLAVQFGANLKGQLASVVLFTLVNGHASSLRDGWSNILEIYLTLFLHSLLPPSLQQQEDFLGGSTAIALQGAVPTPQPMARSDGGLLSALSSYLMTPYGSASEDVLPEATEKEIENTLCTIDCISACRIDSLYAEITKLDPEALISVLRAARALADSRSEDHLSDAETHSSRGGPTYDPGAVFLLELMQSLTLRGSEAIEELWPVMFEHLNDVLSHASSHSVLLVERAVVGLIKICSVLAQKSSMRDQLYLSLDLLGSLPSASLNGVSEQVMGGIVNLIGAHEGLVRSSTEWTLLIGLMRGTMINSGASKISLDFLTDLIVKDDKQPSVTPENFSPILGILQEYISVSSKSSKAKDSQRKAPSSPLEPAHAKALRALDLMFELRKHVSSFFNSSSLPSSQVWTTYSLPLLVALAHQCANRNREVRNQAISHLQRMILGTTAHIMGEPRTLTQEAEIFNRVIFPLVDELLKQEVTKGDPTGMVEAKVKVSALLCRAFLQLQVQSDSDGDRDIRVIWMQVLDLLDRLISRNKRDALSEAIPETLKNVILVMFASELLVPPPAEDDERTKQQKELWTLTFDRTERFLPGFLQTVLESGAASPPVQTLVVPAHITNPSLPSTPSGMKPKSTSIL